MVHQDWFNWATTSYFPIKERVPNTKTIRKLHTLNDNFYR